MSNLNLRLDPEELFQIAEVILAELSGAREKSARAQALGFEDARPYRQKNREERPRERGGDMPQTQQEAPERRSDKQSGDLELRKGLKIKSEHRLMQRTGAVEAGGGEPLSQRDSLQTRRAAVRNQDFESSGIPERISELFCRDARRYDGAFERY